MGRQIPQLPGVKHRFVSAGGLNTHVAIAGKGDPVVLLHGWPEHWYAWRAVIPRLADRYKVICLDLRGFGWTEIAWTGFEKENMADDVLAVLDALEIDKARIVGHDWGGWIGFLLALRAPERVERLVAIGVPTPWSPLTPRNVVAARRFAYMALLAAPFLGQRLVQRPVFLRRRMRKWASKRAAWSGEDMRIFTRELRAPTRARASALLYRAFLTRELLPVIGGRYRDQRLRTPTLLLHGGRDPLTPPGFFEGVERHADDLRVQTIKGAGHFLHEERPKAVARRIRRFFKEDGAPETPELAEAAAES